MIRLRLPAHSRESQRPALVGQPAVRMCRLAFLTAVDELLVVTEIHTRPHRPSSPPTTADSAPDLNGQSSRRRRLVAFVADSGWSRDRDVLGR